MLHPPLGNPGSAHDYELLSVKLSHDQIYGCGTIYVVVSLFF